VHDHGKQLGLPSFPQIVFQKWLPPEGGIKVGQGGDEALVRLGSFSAHFVLRILERVVS
jgi:hypothetical protein